MNFKLATCLVAAERIDTYVAYVIIKLGLF